MKIFQIAIAVALILNGSAFAQNGKLQDEVSFTNDIQPLVREFCSTCHAGDDPEGDLLLTTYAEVRKQAEKGELLERINDAKDPMPEDGLMPQHGQHSKVFIV